MTLLSELSDFELLCLARSRRNVYYLGFMTGSSMNPEDMKNMYGDSKMEELINRQRLENIAGFGALADKPELASTEIVKPQVSKRVFSVWRTRRPSGFGFLISRYNIKLYLFSWTLGLGWIPQEVVWEREQNRSSEQATQTSI